MTLSQYFSLVDVQARMALKSDASRYYLGYAWWILEPLLFVGVFYVVFNVILDSRRADFLIFLMCGKLSFVWFSKTVTQASSSIITNAGLIGQANIPKTLFPMAAIQECFYKQLSVFLLLFAVLMFNGFMPSLSWLQLFPIIIVNYLMIVACSFIGAILVCYVRDIQLLISLGMLFLLFTSGIFWDVHDLGDPQMTATVLTWNPMAFVLDAYRQVLMYQQPINGIHLAAVGAGFAVLTLLAANFMRRKSQSLALEALS
jgi:homopolymeric O-antigen transport system permease protein